MKPLLYLFCCFFLGSVQAQLFQSDVMTRNKTDRTYTLLQFDSSKFAVLRFDKQSHYAEVETYSPKLKHLQTYVCTDAARRYVSVANIKGKIYLLHFQYTENNEKKTYDRVSLYASPIEGDSFKLSKDSIELIAPFRMESSLFRANVVVSPDQNKILVYDYEEEGDIEEVTGLTNEINLRVFDSNLKLLWHRKVNLAPNMSGKRVMAIKQLRISNSGEVAILTDYFRDHRSYSLKEVTADPTLFFVGEKPEQFARFTPNMGEYFFNQVNFSYDHEGNIIWFGFYSKQKYYKQGGYFYIKINAARNKVLHKKMKPFSDELLKELLNKKKLPKIAELRSFNLINYRLLPSGDLVISAEHQPFGVSNFKSHNILVLRLSPEGDIIWQKPFQKFNNYPIAYKVFLSHYLYAQDEVVYLLFNQGLYNENDHAILYKIDKDGMASSKKLFNYLQQSEVLCPTLSYTLSNNRIFICMQSRFFKYYRFGLIELDKLFSN